MSPYVNWGLRIFMKQYGLIKALEKLSNTIKEITEDKGFIDYIKSTNREEAKKLAIQYFVVLLKNCQYHQIDTRFVYKLQIFPEISNEIRNLINTFEFKDEYSQSVLSFLDNVNNMETNLTHGEVLQIGNLDELVADVSKYEELINFM